MAFSANGNLVVTGSVDGTARIWDPRTGRELTVLRGHQSSVETVAFSTDGASVLTTDDRGEVRLWKRSPAPKSAYQETSIPATTRRSAVTDAADRDGRQ